MSIEKFTEEQLFTLAHLLTFPPNKRLIETHGLMESVELACGYNDQSGYVYIAIEGNLAFVANEGRTEGKDFALIWTDPEDGVEYFSYDELDRYYTSSELSKNPPPLDHLHEVENALRTMREWEEDCFAHKKKLSSVDDEIARLQRKVEELEDELREIGEKEEL